MTLEPLIHRLKQELKFPIFDALPNLLQSLQQHQDVILEAPPGAGKTTIVPLALLSESWLQGQKIVMLEPRRLAARAAAERMAKLLGENPGETIGYRVRLDSKVGPKTRIEVVTEGVFTRMLQNDPSLEGIGLVIFDEFHERHLDGDLGLALSLEGRDLFRDDSEVLKLLIMSATLDGEQLQARLANPGLVRSKGRQFPVDVIYSQQSQKQLFGPNYWQLAESVCQKVSRVFEQEPGNILVFLPGQAEIKRCQAMLGDILKTQLPEFTSSIEITPLYGDLKLEQQRQAIAACQPGQYKIVLATSIAESSLTIEGVNTVIDAGLSRQPVFDPKTAMTRLATVKVSQAASKQRAGRAGRLQAGKCYRLWTETEQRGLPEFSPAEIEQADLADCVLAMAAWGVDDPLSLCWISPPPPGPLSQAKDLLLNLNAIIPGDSLLISDHGQMMAHISAHPRIAHMLICAKQLGQFSLACEIAALLMERDFLDRQRDGVDFELRLQALRHGGPSKAKALIQRIKQSKSSFANKRLDSVNSDRQLAMDESQMLALLMALAYPERVARKKNHDGQRCYYQLANGRQASFEASDKLAQSEFIVIAQMGGREGESRDQVFLACDMALNTLNDQTVQQFLAITQQTISYWDKASGAFRTELETRLGQLLITRKPQGNISEEQRLGALLNYIKAQGLECLSWDDDSNQLLARLRLIEDTLMPEDWPSYTEQNLLLELDAWLGPYLQQISKLGQLQSLNLVEALVNRLDWNQQQQLQQWAPSHIKVASGSNIRLDYCQQPPVLAVKLQEMFGCGETPKILQGHVAIMVHLLSPARRPLQVTQDLAGFWRGSYEQVKKEMKGRYPKHPWPDDPANAVATAKTKARK